MTTVISSVVSERENGYRSDKVKVVSVGSRITIRLKK